MKGATADDTRFELSAFERLLEDRPRRRWIGWRARMLVLAALAGCLSLFLLLRLLASAPVVDILWSADAQGRVLVQASRDPALQQHVDSVLVSVSSGSGEPVRVDAALLASSDRWTVVDPVRRDLVARRTALARALDADRVALHFEDGSTTTVSPTRRGIAALPLPFWLLATIALGVYLVGVVVLMSRPRLRNALYAVMALCQSAALAWFAVDTVQGLGGAPGRGFDGLPWRLGLDLATAAAAVHVFALQPRVLARHREIGATAWLVALASFGLAWTDTVPHPWWWGQAATLAIGAAALAVLSHSYAIEPNPFAAVLRRFGVVALGTLTLVLGAVALAWGLAAVPHDVAAAAGVVWYVFFASLLVLVPFLSQTRQLLREFAMLAGLSTVATTLDLLFVSVFALDQFTALTLAMLLALAAYAAVRQWVFSQLLGQPLVSIERIFEQLYRVAREVQQHPERYAALLAGLLRELFDPVEVLTVPKPAGRSRVVAEGAALVVPVSGPGSNPAASTASLVLRFAHGGKRIFTPEDARLTDRVAEQLHRAVLYDQAVERGRSEERLRIAQDLHDDIGARLLTLMYKAQTQEMEDYVRHTLQDLKTLTRGLAAAEHRLSHAAAEWKADIQQRLEAAGVELRWRFDFDQDMVLSVVQWSGLTRVLRELVSNTIYHALATQVDITARLEGSRLTLSVADDGHGRLPQQWSHGLGLGGVRKRVKQFGGTVAWRERPPRGIVCEVEIPNLRGAPA